MIKLGERRTVAPITLGNGSASGKQPKPLTGTVVYMHPAGRFCTLEFAVGRDGNRVRESFQLIKGVISE